MDGLDPYFMVNTGGAVAHVGVLFWRDSDLFILESQHAWYFANNEQKGVQIQLFDTWLDDAYHAGLHVVWLPLNQTYREKLDYSKAWAFFYEKQGKPYGFSTNFFGMVDTDNNLFAPVTGEFYP